MIALQIETLRSGIPLHNIDADLRIVCTQTYLDEWVRDCVVGFGGLSGHGGPVLVEVAGGIGGFSGEIAGGIGGKGKEFHDQHVGKVRRCEEGGDRKGGLCMDSSEESLGMEGIDRSRHGGIDKVEDCRILLGDCRVAFEEESCVRDGGLKSCSMSCKLRMNICLSTVRDQRRMQSSFHVQSGPFLSSQIVETVAQFDHSVKAFLFGRANQVDNRDADVAGRINVMFDLRLTPTTTTTTHINTTTIGHAFVMVRSE